MVSKRPGRREEMLRARGLAAISLLLLAGCSEAPDGLKAVPEPQPGIEPRTYVCQRVADPLTIDGRLDEPAWQAAAWTAEFADISGPGHPAPRFRTRAKMLWDDAYFYVAAQLEEPHVWATLTERDSVIFHDNDFEVFIDPDGDTHEYYELEINALGTEWDLFLAKPYRDGGPADHDWNIPGLLTAVAIEGTLNRPDDEDRGWTVEIAFPWGPLAEYARVPTPPKAGDQWRVNFSRVEWRVDTDTEAYVKRVDAETGKPLPEDNWVWSPQGLVNMHYPEAWGFVQFSEHAAGTPPEPFRVASDREARQALRRLYYRQRSHRAEHGRYADGVDVLDLGAPPTGWEWPPTIAITPDGFTGSLFGPSGRLEIRQDGRIRAEAP